MEEGGDEILIVRIFKSVRILIEMNFNFDLQYYKHSCTFRCDHGGCDLKGN